MCLGAVGDPGGHYGSVSVETGRAFPFVLVGVRACVRFWVGASCRAWWIFGAGLCGVFMQSSVSVSVGSP